MDRGIRKVCLLLFCWLCLVSAASAFKCYTGNQEVLRQKTCPHIGSLYLSDICFKKIGLYPTDPVQRGCFNSLISTLITENSEMGCHKIPDKYGSGTLCLCDTELCNGANGVPALGLFGIVLVGTIVKLL